MMFDVRQIGPFLLKPLFASGSIMIRHESGEGGPMPLRDFEAEVCPWSEVERADEEKVRAFYGKYF